MVSDGSVRLNRGQLRLIIRVYNHKHGPVRVVYYMIHMVPSIAGRSSID